MEKTRDQRNLESRMRRRAHSRGYRIEKARGRLHYDNQGDYQLVDSDRNAVVLGVRYEARLEDIEEFLAEHKPLRLSRWR